VWLPVVIAVFVALTLLVATLSYLLVERPFVVNKQSSKTSSPLPQLVGPRSPRR